MPVTVEAKALVVAGPTEFAGSDGTMISKWEVILDSGAKLLTYSPRCFDAVNSHLNEPLVFLAEPNSRNRDMDPKIVEVRTVAGEELYSAARGKAAAQAGGGGGRPQAAYRNTAEGAQNERQSIHRSVALQQAVILAQHFVASPTPDDVYAFANSFFEWLEDIEQDG